MAIDSLSDIQRAIRMDGRYCFDAFEFLHAGLACAVRRVHGNRGGRRHVTGRQLCEALREVALERWGAMAGAVLERWNIRTTRDFGEMVFLLVRLGVFGKQPSDRLEDFDNVYDFADVFDRYQVRLRSNEKSSLRAR